MDPTATIQADVSSYYDERSITYQQHQQTFMNILDDPSLTYRERVEDMLKSNKRRLLVNLRELASTQRDLFEQIQKIPIQFIAPFQTALKTYINDNFGNDPTVYIDPRLKYSIGFTGLETDRNLTPRDLKSDTIGRLLCVEGIATRCSLVRAKVGQSVHYCDATDRYSTAYYHDNTSLTGVATSTAYPTKDENNNPLETEYGLSYFYNTQSLGLQEMPENTPQGLLPCSINVVMNDDLVDNCKPGDRIRVTGVFRALPSYSGSYENSGLFGSLFIALNLEKIENKLKSTTIDANDLYKIHKFAKRKDCLKILSRSIAPSIYGHEHIKRALLLLLLGGIEKNLDTGTHIRGDINVLMVGDPSTAKSQLLRFVLHLAPLAINTTGRGSSGVGLTAAVVTDKDSGEKRLEAGAMVLADRGVVCIDEFDKMNEMDRVAIHEVMEQQTVTISKAGVHMSLNSRCSVVAAANPIYGKYDVTLKPHVNVGLQDSLLSRFDLLFIVLDRPIATLDRHIAGRVLDNHTARAALSRQLDEDQPLNPADATSIQTTETQVYIKSTRKQTHNNNNMANDGENDEMNPALQSDTDRVTIDFLRKYIAYAKGLTIVLSEQACEYIARRYSEIRQRAKNRDDSSLPITARLLETLIRLSTAVAKSRLGGVVTRHDARIAYRLLTFALNAAEQISKRANRRQGGGRLGGGGGDDDNDDDGYNEFYDDLDDFPDRDDDDDDDDNAPYDPSEDEYLPHEDEEQQEFIEHTAKQYRLAENGDKSGSNQIGRKKSTTSRGKERKAVVRKNKMGDSDEELSDYDNNNSDDDDELSQDSTTDDETSDEDDMPQQLSSTKKTGKKSTATTTAANVTKKTPQRGSKKGSSSQYDDNDNHWGNDEYEEDYRPRQRGRGNNSSSSQQQSQQQKQLDEIVALDNARTTTFKRAFSHANLQAGDSCPVDALVQLVNKNVTSGAKFSKNEVVLILQLIADEDGSSIMLTDDGDLVHII